jgi:hypothetical protein
MGAGNSLGSDYGTFKTWFDLYALKIEEMAKKHKYPSKILGAEATLWS